MAIHMRVLAVDLYKQIPRLLRAKPPGRSGPDMLGSLTAQTPTRVYGQIPAGPDPFVRANGKAPWSQAAGPDRPRYARLPDCPNAGPCVWANPGPDPACLYGQMARHLGAKPPGWIGPDMPGSLTAQTPAHVYR